MTRRARITWTRETAIAALVALADRIEAAEGRRRTPRWRDIRRVGTDCPYPRTVDRLIGTLNDWQRACGMAPTAKARARVKVCQRGHSITGRNIARERRPHKTGDGFTIVRRCRKCRHQSKPTTKVARRERHEANLARQRARQAAIANLGLQRTRDWGAGLVARTRRDGQVVTRMRFIAGEGKCA